MKYYTNLFLFLFSIMFFLLSVTYNPEPKAIEILQKSLEMTNAIQNGYYLANYENLTTAGDDFSVDSVVVNFERIANDTLNGKLKIELPEYSLEYLYDTENIFIASHKKKNILMIDVSKYSVGHITGNLVSDLLFEDYLDPKKIQMYRMNLSNTIELGTDTTINKRDCYRVKYSFKEDTVLNVTDRTGELYIEKSTYFPLGFFKEYRYNDLYSSNKLIIMDYDFNKEKYKNQFAKNQFPDDYEIEIYEYKPVDIEVLQEGDQIDLDFPLAYYESNEPLIFEEQDKLILLDYWYMSCPPCTKATPYMNEIYQKYNSKGLKLIGINPIDKKSEILNKFLKNKKIDYPICLDIEKFTSQMFGVNAYPTFILLKNDGTILHRLDEFDADLINELDVKISKLLQ